MVVMLLRVFHCALSLHIENPFDFHYSYVEYGSTCLTSHNRVSPRGGTRHLKSDNYCIIAPGGAPGM